MRESRGFTLVELMVAMGVGLLVLLVAYNGFHVLFRSARSTERESTRALLEAQILELLLQDLRSAKSVVEVSPQDYQVTRYLRVGPAFRECRVNWSLKAGSVITRQVEGEPIRRFAFVHLIDPKEPPFNLRLERMPDGHFVP